MLGARYCYFPMYIQTDLSLTLRKGAALDLTLSQGPVDSPPGFQSFPATTYTPPAADDMAIPQDVVERAPGVSSRPSLSGLMRHPIHQETQRGNRRIVEFLRKPCPNSARACGDYGKIICTLVSYLFVLATAILERRATWPWPICQTFA